MMYIFYGRAPGLETTGRVLKDIGHEDALSHILKMFANEGQDAIQSIVIHFDEHGQFIHPMPGKNTLKICSAQSARP